ncbi:MAG: LapA family protein [Pseudomonadota bacterium]
MRLIVWFLRALVFFTLFAFALNNQQEATLNWFFGYQWQSRTVFVVLAAFALGCAVGVFAMVPSWWRHRARSKQSPTMAPQSPPVPPPERMPEHPPRDGL